MVAAVFAQSVAHPLDLLRRRLQIDGISESRDIFARTWKLVQAGGIRSMYAGFFPSLLKVIPSAIISKTVRDKVLAFL